MMTKKTTEQVRIQSLNVKKLICLSHLIVFFLFSAPAIYAQSHSVRGKVTDSVGKPLQDVTVAVRGSTTATSTNASGEFVLSSVPDRSTLVFSFVGSQTRELRLSTGQTTLNIVMHAEVTNMQDVVVTGFQRIDRKKFTGSSVTLKAEDVKIEGVTD